MDLPPAALCNAPRKLAMLSLHPSRALALLGTMRMCLARSPELLNYFFFEDKTSYEQNSCFVTAFCCGKLMVFRPNWAPKDGRLFHQVLSHLTVPVIR